jgi:thiosulfate/3-mercaptopyruvate sulfurtransferase
MVFSRRHVLSSFAAALPAGKVLFAQDPWNAAALLEPASLAERLNAHSPSPAIFYVGFPILFKGAHITGAVMAGPCNKPDGIALLKKSAVNLSRNAEVILYCGCCPMDHCPNIRPAFQAMQEMQFSNVKVLHLATNLHTDWTTKGYPTETAKS